MKFLSLTLTILAITATAHLRTEDEAARYFPSSGVHLTADAEWTYSRSAANGVKHWGDANPACLGMRQSPIDLNNAVYNATLRSLNINWQNWNQRTLINTGHAMQVNEATGVSTSTLSGGPLAGSYRALQFHAHAISEHTLYGGSYPLEIHVVHQNADAAHQAATDPSELAVIGLFFREGAHNEALEPFFHALKDIPAKDNSKVIDLNLASLLPHSRDYFTYPGSLTTPGCRETVTWIVMKEVQEVSGAQLEELREVMHLEQNNRPTQPLNGRVVQTNVADATPGMGGAAGNVNINFANMFYGAHL
jgi:carbonic anhydrase